MTQPRSDKILSALGLNKAYMVSFLGRPYTPKRVLPIKVWITPYKSSMSLVLCQCGICLGCYNRCKWYTLISLVKNQQPPDLELGMAMRWGRGREAYPIPHPIKFFCLHSPPHSPINLVGWGWRIPMWGIISPSPLHSHLLILYQV